MTEVTGILVYLVLALTVTVALHAALEKPSLQQQKKKAPANTHAALAALAGVAEELLRQNQSESHALPWVIPPALAPAETGIGNRGAAIDREEASGMHDAVETRLRQMVTEVEPSRI
jgi:hypothetical protein